MNKESRTRKSLKNSSIALIFYFVNMILSFFSRKIFLDYLGAEILGLNTTASNLLQFLNLAELGVGAAVGFSLYKPFYDNDTQAINEIVSLQSKLYRRIAYVVIAASLLLMCFFPLIFAKMVLPLWYAYASFGVLLFSSLLSYFANYRQILLSADQKEYKIQYSYRASLIAKILAQMLVIRFLDNGYIWWLILEVIFAIVASYSLNRVISHTYPFISNSSLSLKELNKKYPMIQTKIKQVFFHKFSLFVLKQTSPLIIYGYLSLTVVALYGNYMTIVLGMWLFADALSNGVTASVGNLFAEGNQAKILSVFDEFFSIRFFIAGVMSFGMIILAQPFVKLWIGESYLLPTSTLFIITCTSFINVSRQAVDSFINANGFFSDIWAPVVEATLNIGLSILLGYYYGLNGILSGVLISLIVIVLVWKPIFLFGFKLKVGLCHYIINYIKHLLLLCVMSILAYLSLRKIPFAPSESVMQFICYSLSSIAIFGVLYGMILYMTDKGMRKFIKRII